ncbi:hypothetical protein ALT_7305 [Aspergillus lentulus]|uniref:Abortive infection protein n=1 Tax=Aspergillus lentulus TaxID=293939 RepID=A0AAN4TD38_ASPLE|nr:uncharacterized protein IFM58399_06175 [Aspergillus lentulus]KAF4157494.1 hypothetical protein CNMCM6069_005588 [Aspergillus lentulus]KAF4167453.1 hypothetical protein CNMCM6936_005069 [Aspergillus lentulus]KAF4176932.1 hypothetical protein CNMCM8060_005865 [Aspergillus lentulus]KAF4186810.1 hypothetical protein CNMCM7927_005050 [Aspergillus lentulus]KAF4196968.1 hypothetical protein CNMCM8694_003988 [Aspergillus lentulus]
MKYRGVVYDVGLNFNGAGFSVEPFDPALVKYDMKTIGDELHANAVRIEGEELTRLEIAARSAQSMGLTVFFNPWKMNATIAETRAYFEEAAKTAERLRNEGIDLVFIAGCEYTIFSKGVFPGDSFNDRVMFLGRQFPSGHMIEDIPQTLRDKSVELNMALRSFVEVIRSQFGGKVTYSAGSWEVVDWDIFDIVGVDYYRRGETAEKYVSCLNRYRIGKPLAVLEVGCCAYEGAAERGDGGFALLKGTNPDGTGIFENDIVPTRSEKEQADYVGTQLELLNKAGVDAAFIFLFSFPCMPAGQGASDLDMMSFALVKTFPKKDSRSNDMPPWVPKESFHRVAEVFRSMEQEEQSSAVTQ